MKKQIAFLFLFILLSCKPRYYTMDDVSGVFRNFDSMVLRLNKDSTCKYMDIGIGVGKWSIQNDSVIICLNESPNKSEPEYWLQSPLDLEGMDTFLIHNKNELWRIYIRKNFYRNGKLIKKRKYISKLKRI